ncbi:hypothetical protein HPB48_014242 [Haemaphysalis longicornis]|uniref:Uncharacterized protein n=1 Tax=Haemaphysalis longicornis TaxID=44386 RepID=A0A9J6FKI8_HAELO|nr:hypothetical protein HPB48_014242 [Haemaphysalis longicornis]
MRASLAGRRCTCGGLGGLANSSSCWRRRRSLRPAGGPSMTQSSDRIWDLLSTSPVRVRNLEQDMEALRQSRHDNPYLQQQMERFSLQDEPATDERQLLFPPDDFRDLHKHLIRSPPPQFPQDVAHFVFPGSPPPVRRLCPLASRTYLAAHGWAAFLLRKPREDSVRRTAAT